MIISSCNANSSLALILFSVLYFNQFSSVAQMCLTLLQPHELQHTRHPCPSPTPRVYSKASLVAQLVKNLTAMWETWVQSLGWEDLLEEAWQPTIVFLPGQRSLVGYSPWGCKELDMTERLSTAQLFCTGIVD